MNDFEEKLFVDGVLEIVDEADKRYAAGVSIEKKDFIPLTDSMPLETNTWWRVDDVVCLYIDMKDSTKLSVQHKDKVAAKIYQYFTGTAVKILDHFGASYIDVRGDGAFGLFDKNKIYHAFSAAITFKTIVMKYLSEATKDDDVKITCHLGMDIKTVLVKRIGMRKVAGKSTKQNEVWAGKPVNMAAKLASKGDANQLLISERVYSIFEKDGSDLILWTCGCGNIEKPGEKVPIWKKMELESPIFDFAEAYSMENCWCESHGSEFCFGIMDLDK